MRMSSKQASNFRIKLHESIRGIRKDQYKVIENPNNPFLDYEFLQILEDSGCVGRDTTWHPRYIELTESDQTVGAITFYEKLDSYGEYIFDWEWARAYQSAGLNYYPKAVVAIPFTPTNGIRILVHKDHNFEKCAKLMVSALIQYCTDRNLSSIHFLFLTKSEQELLSNIGFLSRTTHQYHWRNRQYKIFDDFLADLRSNRRKQIRKERKHLKESGLKIHIFEKDEILKEHIDSIWDFYRDTTYRKWGNPYLNRRFFDLCFEKFRNRIVLVLAKDKDAWVGGTFNIVKNGTLYGRYWGAIADYKNLHFECCYYSLIDYAIKNGIQLFEAGAQGEHKFLRGFAAVPTYSSHFILHDGARKTISKYLDREKVFIYHTIYEYNKQSPLKYLYEEAESS